MAHYKRKIAVFLMSALLISTVHVSPLVAMQGVTVEVVRPANVRNAPTTRGSKILSTLYVANLEGTWITGKDGNRWLKVRLSRIDLMDTNTGPYGYISDINLQETRR